MKSLDDIEITLLQARSPLSASAIAERLAAKGLWQSTAMDPAVSIAGLIASDMKKATSRFVKLAGGMYGVKPSTGNTTHLPQTLPEPSATAPQHVKEKSRGYCDAAVEVLRRHGEPMHGGAIRDEIIAQALIKYDKCPTARTVVGQLSDEATGKKGKHSSNPRLQSTSRGCYGLVEWGKKSEPGAG